MHTLSILPAGIPRLRRCPGEALLPAATGSAVKGYMGSQDPPPQFLSAVPSWVWMFYSLNFSQCYSGRVSNRE